MEKSYFKEFTDYIKNNYDLSDSVIYEKYEHTIRVATLMTYLALRLNLDDNDVLLAFKIGLCHDLGRFREVVRNKDLNQKLNNLTFDHGAYSVKILFNDGLIKLFDVSEDDYLIMKKALYFHNKKDLTEEKLSDRERLFCNMIRDMDKLDLLFIRSNKKALSFASVPTEVVLKHFMQDETIGIKELQNSSDRVIFYLSFIKDLVFDESFNMALSSGYFNKVLRFIEVDESQKALYNQLLEKIKMRKMREKIYVR